MTEVTPQVSQEFIDMLVLVSQHLSRPFEERFRDCFSSLQVYTLCELAMEGPMTMTELASAMCVPKQQMTRIIAKLTEEGYVSRHHDSTDHRVIISQVSQETLERIKQHRERFAQYMNRVFSSLDEDDYDDLIGAVRTITRVMHKLPAQHGKGEVSYDTEQ